MYHRPEGHDQGPGSWSNLSSPQVNTPDKGLKSKPHNYTAQDYYAHNSTMKSSGQLGARSIIFLKILSKGLGSKL